MFVIPALNRDTLSEQAATWLLNYIYSAGLQPGDSLPSVAKIAEQLQVSRPVVREAFKSLQGRGVIRIGNGKSATVSPLDDSILRTFFHRAITFQGHMFQELMELRRGLEIQSAMLAAERRTLDNIREMERTVRAMRESLQNPIPYADLDVSFHLHIAAATRNSLLLSLIDSIRASLRESILYGLQHRATLPDLERVQACHETILDAIRAQDAQAAAQAMTRHFDEALTAVLKGPGETPPNSPDEPRR